MASTNDLAVNILRIIAEAGLDLDNWEVDPSVDAEFGRITAEFGFDVEWEVYEVVRDALLTADVRDLCDRLRDNVDLTGIAIV